MSDEERKEKKAENSKEASPQRIMSPERTRLLHVLLDPDFFTANVTAKCKEAGCDRKTYYNSLANPAFREALRDGALEAMAQDIPALFSAALKVAKTETHAGHQDRKLVFSMLGLNINDAAASEQSSLAAILKELSGLTNSIPKKKEQPKEVEIVERKLHNDYSVEVKTPCLDRLEVEKEVKDVDKFTH